MRIFIHEFIIYVCNHWVTWIPSRYIRSTFYRVVMGFKIHPTAAVHLGVSFTVRRGLAIGAGSVVGTGSHLDTRGIITIENDVSLAPQSIVLTADHDLDSPSFEGRTFPVKIGPRAFVGTRAMLLPGVSLGEGAVVAAGAVVTKDVAAFSVVAGVPAKEIRTRNRNLEYHLSYRRLFH